MSKCKFCGKEKHEIITHICTINDLHVEIERLKEMLGDEVTLSSELSERLEEVNDVQA